MSEIPDDIMEAACEAHERLQQIGAITDDTTDDAPAVYTIARAILAERQRCADVAQKEGDGYKEAGLPQSAMGAYTTRRAILA